MLFGLVGFFVCLSVLIVILNKECLKFSGIV